MGEVYLARQDGPAGFQKWVAVKRIQSHLAEDAAFEDLFLNEARLAARLSHPHIVQIFELGRTANTYFLAMEYVDGISLKALLRRRDGTALPAEIAVLLMIPVVQALGHAHSQKGPRGEPLPVIHRDVSPDNVLVTAAGVVKLVDFGLAQAATAGHTQPGSIRGKAVYMAPETRRRGTADARTDLFSVGVMLIELLTGERPAAGEAGAPPQLARVPLPLRALVSCAVAERPEDRFTHAGELVQALEEAMAAMGASLSQQPLAEFLRRALAEDDRSPGQRPSPAAATQTLERTELTGSPGFPARSLRTSRRRALVLISLGALAAVSVGMSLLFRGPPAPARVERGAAPVPETPTYALPPNALSTPAPDPAPAVVSPPRTAVRTAAPHGLRRPVHLAPGKVILRVSPWAEVFVSGKSVGITPPLAPLLLPPGRQTLLLKNPELGVTRTLTLDVPSGGELTVRENLMWTK